MVLGDVLLAHGGLTEVLGGSETTYSQLSDLSMHHLSLHTDS